MNQRLQRCLAITLLVPLLVSLFPPLASATPQPVDEANPYVSGSTFLVTPLGDRQYVVPDASAETVFWEIATERLLSPKEHIHRLIDRGLVSDAEARHLLALVEEGTFLNYERKAALLRGQQGYIVGIIASSPDDVVLTTVSWHETLEDGSQMLHDFAQIARWEELPEPPSVPLPECPCEDGCNATLAAKQNACRAELTNCSLTAVALETICLLACALATGPAALLCVGACIAGFEITQANCIITHQICQRLALQEWKICLKQCDTIGPANPPPAFRH